MANIDKNSRFLGRLNKNQDPILSLKAKADMASLPAARM